MVNVLFWNTCRHKVSRYVANLVSEHNVHIVILAECLMPEHSVLAALNSNGMGTYVSGHANPGRDILFIHRFQSESVQRVRDTSLASFRSVAFPSGQDVTFASVHFPSKNFNEESDSAYFSREFRHDLEEVETRQAHRRTLVVGDFNMWPFEDGMIMADAMHAVMDKETARRNRRRIGNTYHRFFYNPMWGRLGDTSLGPPGSYYYNRSRPRDYFWHMFDQVILRSELIDLFRDDSLRILTTAGDLTLATKQGRPNKRVSDHFPMLFSLDI